MESEIVEEAFDQDLYNFEILYKYLIKVYEDEYIVSELLHIYKDNLYGENSLAYELGKKSFTFFCLYYLQDVFVPREYNDAAELAPVHYELWEDIERLYIKDEFDKLLAVLPRGTGKSTVMDYALTVWVNAYRFSIYTLVSGKTELDAQRFIDKTRNAFEQNKYIINTFGKLIDSKNFTVNKNEIVLTNNTKIEAISSSSSARGRSFVIPTTGETVRPTLCIFDDWQSQSDILTKDARDKKFDNYMKDVNYVGSRALYKVDSNGKRIKKKMATKMVNLGTVLHSDCLISRLMKNPMYRKIVKKGILVDDIDELFNTGLWSELKKILYNSKDDNALENARKFYDKHYEEMQYPNLWKSYWDCFDLAKDYYENPISFKQEVMNDASNIGDKIFKTVITKSEKEINEYKFKKTILTIDPAGGGKEVKHDYTAFAVGSLTDNGFYIIRKGVIAKIEFEEMIDKAVELLKTYTDITHVWLERNLYQGVDATALQKRIDKDDELKKRKIEILSQHQTKNKFGKISAIAGKVNFGQIIFNSEDEQAVQQLLDYTSLAKHDDFPDTVAECVRLLDEIKTSSGVIFTSFSELLNGR